MQDVCKCVCKWLSDYGKCSKIPDKRLKLSDGTYRARLRIPHERKSIFIATDYSFNEKDYAKMLTSKNMNNDVDMQKAKKGLTELEEKLIPFKDLSVFTFEGFKTRYEQKGDRFDLITLLFDESERLRNNGKFSNANIYLSASRIFEKFAADKLNKNTLSMLCKLI